MTLRDDLRAESSPQWLAGEALLKPSTMNIGSHFCAFQ
jgi:hypothetical protein